MHVHDTRLTRVNAEPLQNGHQRFSEGVECRLRRPHVEDIHGIAILNRRVIHTAAWMASSRLLQAFDAFVIRIRTHRGGGEK